MSIENIKRLAAMIKGETKSGGNTAVRVGGLFEEIGAELENKYDKTEADLIMIRHNTADDSHLNVQESLIQKINDVREMLLAADQSISQDLATHAGTKSIHKTSEEIRAEIVDGDIPETLARVAYVEQEKATILKTAQEYVTQGIAKVVGGAPDALDALNELAAAINNDPNFAASMMALLNSKAESVHSHTRNQITDFPASMPASDVYAWAKQPNKPTYTAGEVGASPSNHNHAGVYQPAGSYAPTTHNHAKSQITDFPASMPASDVYAWAKQSMKPSYSYSEVGAAAAGHNHDSVYQPVGNYATANHGHKASAITEEADKLFMTNTERLKLNSINRMVKRLEIDPFADRIELYLKDENDYIFSNVTLDGASLDAGLLTGEHQSIVGTKNFENHVTFQDGYGISSDIRKKKNIEKIENTEEIIQALTGYKFTYTDSGKKSLGIIAQDLQKILPQIVHEDENGFLSVEYSPLIAVLIEDNKKMRATISELRRDMERIKKTLF